MLNWIHDFIDKRNTPHAQWEIRKVARLMKELLQKAYQLVSTT